MKSVLKRSKKLGLALALLLALLLMGLGLPWASAGGGEGARRIEAYGSGEAISAPWVTYDNLAGGTAHVGSDLTGAGGNDTTGNGFTFAFDAVRERDGTVTGSMKWKDTVLDVAIHGTVHLLEAHPSKGAPSGFHGISFKMEGTTTAEVTIGGIVFPAGVTIRNSPMFDGRRKNHSADTVCFEIFDENGDKWYQWSAYVSGGNVQIFAHRNGDDD